MSQHGNETTNTSILDVLLALKHNVYRSLNTADLCVVREINGDTHRCEYLTDSDTHVAAVKLQGLDIKVNDVVLVTFTSNDFRTSLNAYKTNQANTNHDTPQEELHSILYGVITGLIFRKVEV